MTIVSQNYNNLIKNLIQKHILEATSNITINSYNDVFNHINVIQSFDSILTKAITLSIKAYLEELYILADEKWVATQSKEDGSKHSKNSHIKKVMVKSIVVFDGYSGTKHRTLLHKKVFASDCDNIVTQSLDYIFTVYNTSKIKRVFIMGDGAKWIKSLPQYYKFESTTQVYYCLDKFHFKQALHHLAMNSDYEKCIILSIYLTIFLLNYKKRRFLLFY